jgi:hypothetical protein
MDEQEPINVVTRVNVLSLPGSACHPVVVSISLPAVYGPKMQVLSHGKVA